MRVRVTKDCYCYTCNREFNYLGIASQSSPLLTLRTTLWALFSAGHWKPTSVLRAVGVHVPWKSSTQALSFSGSCLSA